MSNEKSPLAGEGSIRFIETRRDWKRRTFGEHYGASPETVRKTLAHIDYSQAELRVMASAPVGLEFDMRAAFAKKMRRHPFVRSHERDGMVLMNYGVA